MSDPTRAEAAAYKSATPGTLDALRGALMGRMAEVATAFWSLKTKSDGERAPVVVDGWLPPMATNDAERFPFLIVRMRSGIDSQEGAEQNAQATVDILVGTYSDTDAGHRDVFQLIDAIRFDLGAEPAIRKTAFQQTGPLTWEIPVEQTRPQWIGVVTTIWTLPRPRRVEARNPTED